MKQVIRGIDEDAWTATEYGWKPPTVKAGDVEIPKPKEQWTDVDKKLSKYNSRALTSIQRSLPGKQLNLVQGCESAKEAWDILQKHFEGTDKVKSSRLDLLVTKFENLQMGENEKMADFCSQIAEMAQQARVLGKVWKEQKLVKKLLRCLPEKYTPFKAGMSVSPNTDKISFDEMAGMLQAHELELSGKQKTKGIALAAEAQQTQETEDAVGYLVRRFGRAMRKSEAVRNDGEKSDSKKLGKKSFNSNGEGSRKSEVQCYECKGYGHLKTDCPTAKRKEIKCFGCKGFGHTQMECANDQRRRKEKSMLGINEEESDEDSEDDEDLSNFVAFLGIAEFEEGVVASDSEDEEGEEETADAKEIEEELQSSYKEVCETLVRINAENCALLKEKESLEAKVVELQSEVLYEKKLAEDSVRLIGEKMELAAKIDSLEKKLAEVAIVAEGYKSELDQQHKVVKMLTGTKQLDEMLTIGRTEWVNRGLGYNGGGKVKEKIDFVSAGIQPQDGYDKHIPRNKGQKQQPKKANKSAPNSKRWYQRPRETRKCFYCKKVGHLKASCYVYCDKV